jgi:ABC-type uncharacterized transport system ATPase subunit
MTKSAVYAVEMRQIVKRFGSLIANHGIDLTVRRGEVHALLGENGAGKSTLMRILYGLYYADSGEIWVDGRPAAIRSPKDALGLGIGMVTQHFALAAPLSVTENIILGQQTGLPLRMSEASHRVAAVAQQFGIEIEPDAPVSELSVGQRQRVEILKALYRQARILILDEPTAVLTPQEAEQFFAGLKRLQANGLSIIFISHKLNEVMSITDRVTVLRSGEVAGVVSTSETTPARLAQLMVGRVTPGVRKVGDAPTASAVLTVERVSALDGKGAPALRSISFSVNRGEILGIAGVAGNGQVALAEILAGTRRCTAGRIVVDGADITNADPATVMAVGVGRIPEERHTSVVGELSVAQNLALEHLHEFTRRGVLDRQAMLAHAEQLINDYQIKAAPGDPIRTLSGGNMQKVILARVLERNPKVIIVAQPTRGLDVGATEYVHNKLLEQRTRGAAILLISEDLDELLRLSDRIAVIYEGQIIGALNANEAAVDRLGLLMAGMAEDQES